ncbi:MAG: AmmeMemoRadiSam system radical SAM enzyme [Candidatus Aenigmarchaeota archaeon]|nr:AmmeMemoRadiSam system radical SAM enzyme [Candidatus Aenigmarchaeota archaeon]
MKEASFYRKGGKEKVDCLLCARYCKNIPDGSSGFCGVRKNVNGNLMSLVYGKPCSVAVDPVEKKPLFHFAPGTQCLSIATVGCNFRCMHCQNWEISQPQEISGDEIPPKEVVEMARACGVSGIAYTYTEPTVFYEYAYDTMKLADKSGLYNVWVSNGYTAPDAIKQVSKHMDAVNVDIKGDDKFYRKVCAAPGIQPVYDALLEYKKHKVWTEVTTLMIPGYNNKPSQIKGVVKWVHDNLGPDVPMHFSAFHPTHRLTDAPSTPLKTLEKCHEIARKEGMKWVYLGNVRSGKESTFCPSCGEVVISRSGYRVSYEGASCPKCGEEVPIAGKKWLKTGK